MLRRLPPALRQTARGMSSMIGLEVFESSWPSLLSGAKKASVRDFALPAEFLNQPICLLSRADPPAGAPLPDELPAGAGGFRIAGVVVFADDRVYASRAEFDADEERHQVLPGTAVHAKYAALIEQGGAHAWSVASVQNPPHWYIPSSPTPAIRRRHNALFDVEPPPRPHGSSGSSEVPSKAVPPPSPPTPESLKLYRFGAILPLRMALRVKVVQLGFFVSIALPLTAAYQKGTGLTLVDAASIFGIVAGSVGMGGSLSYLVTVLPGELSWRYADRALRISTLSVWGARIDTDYSIPQLAALGIAADPAAPRPQRLEDLPDGELPSGMQWLEIGGLSYLLVFDQISVKDPLVLALLLQSRQLHPGSPAPPPLSETTPSA